MDQNEKTNISDKNVSEVSQSKKNIFIINVKRYKKIVIILLVIFFILISLGIAFVVSQKNIGSNSNDSQKKLVDSEGNLKACSHFRDKICPDGSKATRTPPDCSYKCPDIQELKNQKERSLTDLGISASIPNSFNMQECKESRCRYYKNYAPGISSSDITITKEVDKNYQIKINDPSSLDNLEKLKIGDSIVLSDTTDTNVSDSFTYTRLNDIEIGGFTAKVYENKNPWEGNRGTVVRIITVNNEKDNYTIGGSIYADNPGKDVNGITLGEFSEFLNSVKFTEPTSTGVRIIMLTESSNNPDCPNGKESCLLLSNAYNEIVVKNKDGKIIGGTPSVRKDIFTLDLPPGEYIIYAANKTPTNVFITDSKKIEVRNGRLTNTELVYKIYSE